MTTLFVSVHCQGQLAAREGFHLGLAAAVFDRGRDGRGVTGPDDNGRHDVLSGDSPLCVKRIKSKRQ